MFHYVLIHFDGCTPPRVTIVGVFESVASAQQHIDLTKLDDEYCSYCLEKWQGTEFIYGESTVLANGKVYNNVYRDTQSLTQ